MDGKIPYKDIADMPEDDRIRQIGDKVMNEHQIVGFFVDKEPGHAKANRYIAKLKERYPGIRLILHVDGMVPGTELVKVGPPLN